MAQLYEFRIARSMARDVVEGVPGPWTQGSFAHFALDAEGMPALDKHLRWFGSTAEELLFFDALTRSRGGSPDPVAVVVYPRDYRVTGHFLDLRRDRTDVKCTYASYRPSEPPVDYPPLSIIYLPDWTVAEDLAQRSPLLAGAWQQLTNADRARRWFCLADDLPTDWIAATESVDRELFRRIVGR